MLKFDIFIFVGHVNSRLAPSMINFLLISLTISVLTESFSSLQQIEEGTNEPSVIAAPDAIFFTLFEPSVLAAPDAIFFTLFEPSVLAAPESIFFTSIFPFLKKYKL